MKVKGATQWWCEQSGSSNGKKEMEFGVRPEINYCRTPFDTRGRYSRIKQNVIFPMLQRYHSRRGEATVDRHWINDGCDEQQYKKEHTTKYYIINNITVLIIIKKNKLCNNV